MRFIRKGKEPAQLTKFKAANRSTPELLRYDALSGNIKFALKKRMLDEQGSLCAYTMKAIGRAPTEDFHIEHVRPQRAKVENELDYFNMVLCTPRGDAPWGARKKHGANTDDSNFVSPLTTRCEICFKFDEIGRVKARDASNDAAARTVTLLGLNHRDLVDARASVLAAFGLGPKARKAITASKAEFLALEIVKPDNAGRLQPFCLAIQQVAECFARQSRDRAARLAKAQRS